MAGDKELIIDGILGDTKHGFSPQFVEFVGSNKQFLGVNDAYFMRLFIDQFGNNSDPSLTHSLIVDYFNFSNEFKRIWEQKFIPVNEQLSTSDGIVF